MLSRLRAIWQQKRVELLDPMAAAIPAWLLSLTLHVVLLISISLLTYAVPLPFELTLRMPEEPLAERPQEFHFHEEIFDQVGAVSQDGVGLAMEEAPVLADVSELATADVDPLDIGDIEFVDPLRFASTPLTTSKQVVRGIAGVGVTGATGAIDRLTHEILLSLEDNDTLVVWLFDRSGSLTRQRREINERLGRIYEELGLVRHDLRDSSNRQPLLTAVLGFGQTVDWQIRKPTANVEDIKNAVASITMDDSGIENVFTGIYTAAEEFQKWRSKRNIMLIAVTDEVGDDAASMLEKCVDTCRKYAMPVYVLGVPAAFGETETLLKWVDPDPNYSQRPQWGRVNQGPESLRPERLQLPFTGVQSETMDSGFGPFALTRLCYQSGGIYFTIHPNRRVGRRVGRRETNPFSAHFAYFFDPQRMRPYRPEYVSIGEYDRRARASRARTALLHAATMSINRMDSPRLHFVKRDEAQFVADLTEAQKMAAKLEPKLVSIHEILKRGDEDRQSEESLRWQAAFDLAFGQTLAVLVRTRAYNEMLAKAKRGLEPDEASNNTWRLVPDQDLSISSRLERDAERAEEYLTRVSVEHEGTPWALLAKRELTTPLGWRWEASYTPQADNTGPAVNNNDNAPRIPRDDQKRMLPKPPPTRQVPKL